MIVKEYKHIWFDSGFLFLTVFSPAVLLTLLTYVFSFNVQEADLAILNQDQSPQSFAYIRTLTANGDLTERLTAENYA
jgi:ABC-type Na+ efflux pump permease subunit